MGWDLTGMTVWARYLDEYDIYGRVESSRVKYGGEVQHTVVLAEPIVIYGQLRDRVLIENKSVTRVKDSVL
jgi:hypothetical protein